MKKINKEKNKKIIIGIIAIVLIISMVFSLISPFLF